jgi:type VI secretion system Hcp family effector
MVMEITSARGEKLEGEVTARGKEGAIEVLSFHHEVKSPRDAASGLATGRRQHQPLLIRKRIDKASPLLMKALVDNTPLTVTVKFHRASADGRPEHYYTITLEEVFISGMSVFGFDPQPIAAEARASFVIPHVLDTSGRVLEGAAQQEEVSLTFRKITYTNEVTKTTVQDAWSPQ